LQKANSCSDLAPSSLGNHGFAIFLATLLESMGKL
jgi:hypothetical protein